MSEPEDTTADPSRTMPESAEKLAKSPQIRRIVQEWETGRAWQEWKRTDPAAFRAAPEDPPWAVQAHQAAEAAGHYAACQFWAVLRITRGHFEAAQAIGGILPDPDVPPNPTAKLWKWSVPVVRKALSDVQAIWDAVGTKPAVWDVRLAQGLARRTGLPIKAAHIPALVEQGRLTVVGQYRKHPLYLPAQADRIERDDLLDVLAGTGCGS
jgi:hypothetical protein